MKSLRLVTLLCCLLPLGLANAARIKDISSVEGVRSNQLIGYGLVVGLPGTGEKNNAFTEQTFRTMLNNFGIKVPDNIKPKIKDVAPVAIHADLPPFSKPGQSIDVTVSAIGEAKSLRGGSLILTSLRGVDGQVYALAQGSLTATGVTEEASGSKVTRGVPTAARIPSGGIVERSVANPFDTAEMVLLNVHASDFTTTTAIVNEINKTFGAGVATPLDAVSISLRAPQDIAQRVSFMSMVENLRVTPGEPAAKVVVNSKTGTVVISRNVKVTAAAVSHGTISVTVAATNEVVQPNALAGGQTATQENADVEVAEPQRPMFLFQPGVDLRQIVDAINQVGATPSALIAILEALKSSGSLRAELVVI